MVDEHLKNLSVIEWRRENSLVLSYVQVVSETDRFGSNVVDLRLRSNKFMSKVIPLLINLNKLTILHKMIGAYTEW